MDTNQEARVSTFYDDNFKVEGTLLEKFGALDMWKVRLANGHVIVRHTNRVYALNDAARTMLAGAK